MPRFAPPAIQLEAAVRTLVGRGSARVSSWQRTAVDWQVVSGPGTLIVKVNRRPAGLPLAAEAEWRQEVWAYTTGLLRPRDGFALARLLRVSHPSSDETWLWLEDVPDEGGPLWTLERHVAAARHLGVFNGSHPLSPAAEPGWLRAGWLGELHPLRDEKAAATLSRDEVWRHPLVQRAFPEPVFGQLERLARLAPELREGLATLPRSLCHLDPGQFNLRSRTREDGELETVVLDWQLLSSGPLGTDLAMMNTLNLCRLYVRPEEARRYGEATFAAYLGGLRRGGAVAEPGAVYRPYSALTSLRAGAIVEVLVCALVEHPERQPLAAQWGARQGLDPSEALQAWGRNMRVLLRARLKR